MNFVTFSLARPRSFEMKRPVNWKKYFLVGSVWKNHHVSPACNVFWGVFFRRGVNASIMFYTSLPTLVKNMSIPPPPQKKKNSPFSFFSNLAQKKILPSLSWSWFRGKKKPFGDKLSTSSNNTSFSTKPMDYGRKNSNPPFFRQHLRPVTLISRCPQRVAQKTLSQGHANDARESVKRWWHQKKTWETRGEKVEQSCVEPLHSCKLTWPWKIHHFDGFY